MSGLDDILRSLPMGQLAGQLGVDEATAAQAAQLALPALLGGLQANASDPKGAASILDALGQHDGSVFDRGIDLQQVDTNDGAKISSHIFGDNEEQVVHALGGAGGSVGGQLIKKLLPLLAPLVLSYLAKQMQGGGARGRTTGGGAAGPSLPTSTSGGARESGAPGSLEDLLGQVLGGAASGGAAEAGRAQSQARNPSSGGSIITDILGGLLGGGRR